MAGVGWRVNSGEVSLSAGVAKTALQVVAPANQRVLVDTLGVYFKGTSASDTPVKVRVITQTTAGTSSAATVNKRDVSDDETLQTTARYNASAEPTNAGDGSEVVDFFEIHPQAGFKQFYPIGRELIVKGGTRLGVECTAAEGQTVVVTMEGTE